MGRGERDSTVESPWGLRDSTRGLCSCGIYRRRVRGGLGVRGSDGGRLLRGSSLKVYVSDRLKTIGIKG
ncbi:hypothetical protein TIFTF001_027112 [Ficus carica]|uniref:Uncharacterized protein n=1 Tax=Ficus carica TaxID=3494 RepID=A0AA88DNK6_FICCA|nr:hypothetical protein TIFTF001_027112 [Ficus carica]